MPMLNSTEKSYASWGGADSWIEGERVRKVISVLMASPWKYGSVASPTSKRRERCKDGFDARNMRQNVQVFPSAWSLRDRYGCFGTISTLVQRDLYHSHDCDFLTARAGG